jgi:hypothetical protein
LINNAGVLNPPFGKVRRPLSLRAPSTSDNEADEH